MSVSWLLVVVPENAHLPVGSTNQEQVGQTGGLPHGTSPGHTRGGGDCTGTQGRGEYLIGPYRN